MAAPIAVQQKQMLYRLLADAVIVVHFTFIVFVVFGGLLAWWVPRVRWIHLASVAYGAGIVFVGWSCPLTDIERTLWRAAGETTPTDGFVERFLEGVIYPGDLTTSMRVLAGLVIAASWTALLARHRRNAAHSPRVTGPAHEWDHAPSKTGSIPRQR